MIATPNGSPPHGLLVEKINREQLYFSKHDVESQNIISRACFTFLCTRDISGVHAVIISGIEELIFFLLGLGG